MADEKEFGQEQKLCALIQKLLNTALETELDGRDHDGCDAMLVLAACSTAMVKTLTRNGIDKADIGKAIGGLLVDSGKLKARIEHHVADMPAPAGAQ